MLHLKTKQGTFWMIPVNNSTILFGVDDHSLAKVNDQLTAIDQLSSQTTGYLRWDSLARVNIKTDLQYWQQGAPEYWS